MAVPYVAGGQMTLLNATGLSTISSGFVQIIGMSFVGSATGSIQFFAGVTASASITPVITYSGTATAVAAFMPLPMLVSGTGLTVKIPGTLDPNVMLYWLPVGGP